MWLISLTHSSQLEITQSILDLSSLRLMSLITLWLYTQPLRSLSLTWAAKLPRMSWQLLTIASRMMTPGLTWTTQIKLISTETEIATTPTIITTPLVTLPTILAPTAPTILVPTAPTILVPTAPTILAATQLIPPATPLAIALTPQTRPIPPHIMELYPMTWSISWTISHSLPTSHHHQALSSTILVYWIGALLGKK